MEAPLPGGSMVSRGHLRLLVSAAIMLYAVVTAGGIVCITGSGAGCPGWPRCDGQVVPPARTDAIIEYVHRLIAVLGGATAIAAAVAGWGRFRGNWWLGRAPAVSAIGVLSAGTLGAVAVTGGIPAWLAAVDRGCALAALALMSGAAVVACSARNAPERARLSFDSRRARLTLATAAAAFALLVSGVLVADSSSLVRCFGWPVRWQTPLPGALNPTPGTLRQLLALGTGVLLAAVVVLAFTHRTRVAVRGVAGAAGFLFAVETALGMYLRADGASPFLLAVSVAATSAFWVSLVVLTVLTALPPPGAARAAEPRDDRPAGPR